MKMDFCSYPPAHLVDFFNLLFTINDLLLPERLQRGLVWEPLKGGIVYSASPVFQSELFTRHCPHPQVTLCDLPKTR